jgi:hypothetical protein
MLKTSDSDFLVVVSETCQMRMQAMEVLSDGKLRRVKLERGGCYLLDAFLRACTSVSGCKSCQSSIDTFILLCCPVAHTPLTPTLACIMVICNPTIAAVWIKLSLTEEDCASRQRVFHYYTRLVWSLTGDHRLEACDLLKLC